MWKAWVWGMVTGVEGMAPSFLHIWPAEDHITLLSRSRGTTLTPVEISNFNRGLPPIPPTPPSPDPAWAWSCHSLWGPACLPHPPSTVCTSELPQGCFLTSRTHRPAGDPRDPPVIHWTPSPALSPFTYLGVGFSLPSLRMQSTCSSSCPLPPCRWQQPQLHGSPQEYSASCCSHLLAWPLPLQRRCLISVSAHPWVSAPTSAPWWSQHFPVEGGSCLHTYHL